MSEEIAVSRGLASLPEAPRADSDAQLLEIWLHGRSRHTQRAYRADVEHFLEWARRPLLQVTLADLQRFADALGDLAPSSRYRTLSALKSLLAFGHRTGYLVLTTAVRTRR
jgi:integrase/recombinase XerD